jgi:hypothetical protein
MLEQDFKYRWEDSTGALGFNKVMCFEITEGGVQQWNRVDSNVALGEYHHLVQYDTVESVEAYRRLRATYA